MENNTITMELLKRELSASINMLKGFCHNGKRCNAWRQVKDDVIDFGYVDNTYRRFKLSQIKGFENCMAYDERYGRERMFRNVLTDDLK